MPALQRVLLVDLDIPKYGVGHIPVIAAQRCLPALRLVYGCLQTFTGTALRHSPSMTFRMTAAQASEMALPTHYRPSLCLAGRHRAGVQELTD